MYRHSCLKDHHTDRLYQRQPHRFLMHQLMIHSWSVPLLYHHMFFYPLPHSQPKASLSVSYNQSRPLPLPRLIEPSQSLYNCQHRPACHMRNRHPTHTHSLLLPNQTHPLVSPSQLLPWQFYHKQESLPLVRSMSQLSRACLSPTYSLLSGRWISVLHLCHPPIFPQTPHNHVLTQLSLLPHSNRYRQSYSHPRHSYHRICSGKPFCHQAPDMILHLLRKVSVPRQYLPDLPVKDKQPHHSYTVLSFYLQRL